MIKFVVLALCVSTLVFPATTNGAPITLSAGETLNVPFAFTQADIAFNIPDVFIVEGATTTAGAMVSVNIFDEGVLLASDSGLIALPNYFIFRSSTSLFTGGPLIDFSTLMDGTSQGLVQILLLNGSATFDADPNAPVRFTLAVGQGTNSSQFTVQTLPLSLDDATVTAEPTEVPEPATLATLGVGLLALARRRQHRRSQAS